MIEDTIEYSYSRKQAEHAAHRARIKGWPTKVTYQQKQLDVATVVSKKPGTNWYLVARWVNARAGADKPCLRLWVYGNSSLRYLVEADHLE